MDFVVDAIKREFKSGTRIKLIHMSDDIHPIPDGMLGTVDHVDDMGTVHVNWDNGRYLGVVLEEDEIEVID